MLQWQVLVTILCACLSYAQKTDTFLPKPEVDIINHERFQISIEDHPGITFVGFNANVNTQKEIGTYIEDVSHPVHGRWAWICDLPQDHLSTNNIINYWVSVHYNRTRITTTGTYPIGNIPDYNTEHAIKHSQYARTNITCKTPSTLVAPSISTENTSHIP